MHRRPGLTISILAAAAVAAGCLGSASPSPSEGPSTGVATPQPSPSGSQPPAPSATPVPLEPTPSPTPSATAIANGRIRPGDSLEVIVDALRVRSLPRVADDSRKLTPLLSKPSVMYVYEGPVKASGYTWYRVLPFDVRDPVGWIAVASRDGEPWVRRADVGCDAIGVSVTLLASLSPGDIMACYTGGPITVDARIVDCNADVDGPPVDPAWFGFPTLTLGGKRICPALAEPDAAHSDFNDLLFAHFDPDGQYPVPLPIDTPVLVTGMFDHPAAQECRSEGEMAPDDPVLLCRTTFAITAVRPAG